MQYHKHSVAQISLVGRLEGTTNTENPENVDWNVLSSRVHDTTATTTQFMHVHTTTAYLEHRAALAPNLRGDGGVLHVVHGALIAQRIARQIRCLPQGADLLPPPA